MSRSLHGTIGAALLCCVALSSQSQQPAAQAGRPQAVAKPAQQSTDEQQCYDWAKAQTGIDPQALPAAAPTESPTFKKAMGTCLQGRGYTTG